LFFKEIVVILIAAFWQYDDTLNQLNKKLQEKINSGALSSIDLTQQITRDTILFGAKKDQAVAHY